jgi:voltage-gated potassium channel
MYIPLRSILSDRAFKALLSVVVVILLIGTIFYSQFEHWRMLDSLYFSVITLTTVGYGDLTPQTDAGKIFTIVYIFFGIGIILAFVSVITKITSKHYTKLSEAYTKHTEAYLEAMIEKTIGRITK